MSGGQYNINDGAVVRFFRPSTAQVSVLPTGTPIDGNDGADGTNGHTILSTTGAPSALLGSDGDYALDLTPPVKLYGPKAAGAWPAGVSLQGPQGPAGSGGGHPFLLMGA